MSALRRSLTAVLCSPWLVAALAVGLVAGAPAMSEAQRQMVSFAIVNIALAQSLNLLTGLAGQISLAHGALMGIAAFTTVLMVKFGGWSPLVSVPAGALLSAATGWLLSFPAARVKEFYLAMMSLGFGMIFIEVVREWESVTGGVMGITGVPSPQLKTLVVGGVTIGTALYVQLLAVFAAAMLFALDRFVRSRYGRALLAVHTSELAARSIGIPAGRLKRLAYALSAGLAGLAGAIYGHLVSYIGPESFEVGRSIEVLVMSVVGGLGSLAGQVLGAVLITTLPLWLEAFADFKFIVYGIVLTLIFVVMPSGLAGLLLEPPRFIAGRWRRPAPAGQAGDAAEAGTIDAGGLGAAVGAAAARAPRVAGAEVLRWEGLRRDFAGLVAVDDFSCELRAGEVLGLIGPNGSGKSTTINVLTGVYPPSAGRVLLKGEDVSGRPIEAIAARGMVRTFQDPRLVGRFTVLENVLLGTHLHQRYGVAEAATGLGRVGADERAAIARAEAALAATELGEVRDRVLDTLPYGYRRLVEIARALTVGPDVLLLDEPGAGLSEAEIGRLERVVRQLAAAGVAVMIVDHHMDLLAGLVDRVVVLDSGEEIFRGSMADMRRDPKVAECYLGRTEHAPDAEAAHA